MVFALLIEDPDGIGDPTREFTRPEGLPGMGYPMITGEMTAGVVSA